MRSASAEQSTFYPHLNRSANDARSKLAFEVSDHLARHLILVSDPKDIVSQVELARKRKIHLLIQRYIPHSPTRRTEADSLIDMLARSNMAARMLPVRLQLASVAEKDSQVRLCASTPRLAPVVLPASSPMHETQKLPCVLMNQLVLLNRKTFVPSVKQNIPCQDGPLRQTIVQMVNWRRNTSMESSQRHYTGAVNRRVRTLSRTTLHPRTLIL